MIRIIYLDCTLMCQWKIYIILITLIRRCVGVSATNDTNAFAWWCVRPNRRRCAHVCVRIAFRELTFTFPESKKGNALSFYTLTHTENVESAELRDLLCLLDCIRVTIKKVIFRETWVEWESRYSLSVSHPYVVRWVGMMLPGALTLSSTCRKPMITISH